VTGTKSLCPPQISKKNLFVVIGNISQILEWFILVDIFIGLLFTISVSTTYMTAPIPPHFREVLLPEENKQYSNEALKWWSKVKKK
jgi:hypothetical protein